MGQYYKFVNLDKMEEISSYDFDNGAKLMEFSYQGNKYVAALFELLSGRWCGDRVYCTGDYDDEVYGEDEIYTELADEKGTKSLYDLEYKTLKPGDLIGNKKEYVRLYNLATREFVDLTKLPTEWIYTDDDGIEKNVSISPLPLLITFNNGAGGSYYGKNMDLIGSWTKYSKDIIVSTSVIENLEENFDELIPNFTEREDDIPEIDELEQKDLICLLEKYSDYVTEFYDNHEEGMQPVSVYEFYKNEF